MIADHRWHSFDAEIPRIKLLVLAGQLPALGHRSMLAQRRAAVPGAGRVALDQRHPDEECDARPAPHPPGHRNHLRHHGRRAGPVSSAKSCRFSSLIARIDAQGRGRQYIAPRLGNLTGTRAAGFVLTRQDAVGVWGPQLTSCANQRWMPTTMI
jgi:hypothetical protein